MLWIGLNWIMFIHIHSCCGWVGGACLWADTYGLSLFHGQSDTCNSKSLAKARPAC